MYLIKDRRLWNKSKSRDEFNLEYPDNNTISDASLKESQKRYEEYLFNLHLNNQITKLMHKKDKKEEELEKLETGFNTYVNGAHKKNEKYTPRYTITKTSSATNSCSSRHFTNSKFNIPINLESLCSSRNSSANVTPATTSRKKWGNSSFIFKTTDGCEIKISSPNHYKKNDSEPKKTLNSNETITSNECEYSDDFESDEDTNANKKKILDENLIETVKFSSDEEDTTEITSNKKNFVFKLTKNDVKVNSKLTFSKSN
jgi:hypothetical protein